MGTTGRAQVPHFPTKADLVTSAIRHLAANGRHCLNGVLLSLGK